VLAGTAAQVEPSAGICRGLVGGIQRGRAKQNRHEGHTYPIGKPGPRLHNELPGHSGRLADDDAHVLRRLDGQLGRNHADQGAVGRIRPRPQHHRTRGDTVEREESPRLRNRPHALSTGERTPELDGEVLQLAPLGIHDPAGNLKATRRGQQPDVDAFGRHTGKDLDWRARLGRRHAREERRQRPSLHRTIGPHHAHQDQIAAWRHAGNLVPAIECRPRSPR
jgi:hypothetical protein